MTIIAVDYDGTSLIFTDANGTTTSFVVGQAIATFLRDCIQEAWQVSYIGDDARWGMSI